MTILIEKLSFEAVLGILEHERTNPQPLLIDCRIEYPYAPGSFIDYADVAFLIESTMKTEQFELVETALEFLTGLLKTTYPQMSGLDLTIRKPSILPNCTVGVQKNSIF